MNKQYLLSMTKEDFNAKVLCEGFDAVKRAAKILEVEVNQEDRWVATNELYKAFLSMKGGN